MNKLNAIDHASGATAATANPVYAPDARCAQFHFRTQKTHHFSLTAIINVLWTDARWTTLEQRADLERRLLAGEAIETKHARYQVIPTTEGITP